MAATDADAVVRDLRLVTADQIARSSKVVLDVVVDGRRIHLESGTVAYFVWRLFGAQCKRTYTIASSAITRHRHQAETAICHPITDRSFRVYHQHPPSIPLPTRTWLHLQYNLAHASLALYKISGRPIQRMDQASSLNGTFISA